MIPMLDASPNKILEWREKYDIEILQLASPLTRNRHHPGIEFGYDCGAYTMHPLSNPNWIPEEKAQMYICKWVVLPDVVGCARATNAMFHLMKDKFRPHQRAIVAQNGSENDQDEDLAIPWEEIGCLFIGGTSEWKDTHGVRLAIHAKTHYPHIWVHVGRVNTKRRVSLFFDHADSFDGSGLVRFGMLEDLVPRIKELQSSKQKKLEDFA